MANADEKRCPKCLQTLPATAFYADRHQRGGLSVYCRPCHRERQRVASRAAAADPVKAARRRDSCNRAARRRRRERGRDR